jgi:hypothetical protein
VVRLVLLLNGWPAVTAEEGTFGLEAMHIAYRGAFPVFMYGQDYMGTIEAYLGALMFHLFGVSWLSLRLGMLPLFVLFLLSLYWLTALLYSTRFALFMLLLFCFGSFDMLVPEMMVVGGALETLVFGTLLLLIATRLSLSASQQAPAGQRWRRLAGFIAWGICAGLGLWSHLLVAPFVLVSGLLLLLFCRRELVSLAPIALLLGLVIGLLPLILYNLHAAPGHNSWNAFVATYLAGNQEQAPFPSQMLKQVLGTFLFALPGITGLPHLYPSNPLPLPYFSSTMAPLPSILAAGGWSLGYVLLFVLACSMAGRGWRQVRSWYPNGQGAWSLKDRQRAVTYAAQLMLLLAAAITLLLFLFSTNAASRPWSTRYLVGLLIALPAVLWPLWNGINTYLARFSSAPEPAYLVLAFRRVALILLICLLGGETIVTAAQQAPANLADNAQVEVITHDLARLGITRFYSGYWQCDRFIFQTREALTCAVVNPDLSPGLTRYHPYAIAVRNDPGAAYVFPANSIYASAFESLHAGQQQAFRQILINVYVIYVPRR